MGNELIPAVTPEGVARVRYIHVSKELSVRPRMSLGADGKLSPTGDYDFYVERGTGKTYRRPTTKPRSRRDTHRLACASRSMQPTNNDWGSETFKQFRDRQAAGIEQRRISDEWKALEAMSRA
jgi:hypothetical protein